MAIYKNGNNSYEIRVSYKDSKGKYRQHHKTGFNSKKEAEEYIDLFKGRLNENYKPEFDKITFSDYFKDWYYTYKEPTLSDNTKRRYQTYLRLIPNYFGKAKLCTLTRKDYQLIINKYGSEHIKDSVDKFDYAIRMAVKSALLDGIITKDFTEGISLISNENRKIKVDYLNLKEIKITINYLINHLNSNKKVTNNYIFILTGFFTGMRLGEIQALTWNDVNFTDCTININKSWDSINYCFKPTKTKASNRVITVPNVLINILKNKKTHSNNELIFYNNTANRVPLSSNVNKSLRRIFKRLNIDRGNYHFHSIRHSYVALVYSLGIDFYTISKQLGHANPTTTINTYAYLIEEMKKEQETLLVHKLDNIFTFSNK